MKSALRPSTAELMDERRVALLVEERVFVCDKAVVLCMVEEHIAV